MSSSQHFLYTHSGGASHRAGVWERSGTLLGLEVSAAVGEDEKSERWEQASAVPSFGSNVLAQVNVDVCVDVRLNSTAVRLDICALCSKKAAVTAAATAWWLEIWEVARNLSPVQDGPRDCRIDGDPKGLRICFHSECSPSAWLEREPMKLEKTLSTDR